MKTLPSLLIITLACSLSAADGKRLIQSVAISDNLDIDGRLEEPCFSMAQPGDAFVQFHPTNGAKATLATEVYVFFDPHHLYVAFRCHDPEPGKIKADITPFGGFVNNDEVTVMLDPFADQRNYVIFTVNARGIRSGEDTIWKASARIDEGGWCAEIEIPFKSLRFPAAEGQDWRVNFCRRVFRLNETDYWSPATREQETILASTFGVLSGLRRIRGGKNLEVFPYSGLRDSKSDDLHENRLAYGLDLKYGITSNLTLDLTTSPDYSDVESDPFFNQTSPYEYSLTEKRPFYSEGADFFGTSFSLFYSRRITNPKLALKISGKEKGVSMGFLLASNDLPSGDRFHGVLRVKKDVFRLSYVGAIYSAVEGAGAWNRNAGIDFQFRIREVYTLSGFAAFSFNKDARNKQNGIFRLLFSQKKENGFSWAGIYDRVEPHVRVPAGFIAMTDYQKIWLLPRYFFLWEGNFLERLQLVASLVRYNAVSSGEVTGIGGEFVVNAFFRNQLEVSASYLLSRDRPQIVNNQGGLEWNREMFPQNGPFFWVNYSGLHLFQAGGQVYSYSGGIYTEDFRQVKAGKTTIVASWMNLKLSPNWQWEWNFEHTRQVARDRSMESRWSLLSTALRWQASRTFSASARFQYDSLQSRFGYDLLLLYEPAPVSRMVVSLKNHCEERFRLFQPQARTLVIKLSYLIRI